ncbi:CARDB domain-containing protein [Fulvivirga sedimenti]|uniref:CARDB domain-containing protein n=1 Tax=Fulvivirga sedimenti TaxID=2879465 RepID=A0A9X1HNR9_9BACT|nr:CARDB domain-containing protein [Fulvivirga sedimenti]MCA6073992.1 hypothetical protein [Fulvivirga sedimenti]
MKLKQIIIIATTVILFSCGQNKDNGNGKAAPQASQPDVEVQQPDTEIPEEEVIAKLPDLVIISSSVSPAGMVAPKTKCTFTFEVKNIGEGDYDHTIVVGGAGIVANGINSLKAGETKKVIVEYMPYSKNATYTLKFKVDPDDVIKESNESNNESQTYTIKTTF